MVFENTRFICNVTKEVEIKGESNLLIENIVTDHHYFHACAVGYDMSEANKSMQTMYFFTMSNYCFSIITWYYDYALYAIFTVLNCSGCNKMGHLKSS